MEAMHREITLQLIALIPNYRYYKNGDRADASGGIIT
jgi:hypothetical protein